MVVVQPSFSCSSSHHMCYSVQGEVEEEVVRDVLQKKWVIEEPANCQPPFPCFGVVKEVMVLERVAVTVSVCQLEPLWRQPRLIQETFDGVTIVLSLGYFKQKNFSNQVLCIWNITCSEDQILFVKSHNTSRPDGSGEMGSGEFAVVEWEGGREVRCAEQPITWLDNKVFLNGIKVIHRSPVSGSFGTGLRLDTACYPLTPPQQVMSGINNCSHNYQLPSQDHSSLELSAREEQELTQAFSLHFDLHLLMDRCSRSVRECGIYHSHHMPSTLAAQLQAIQSANDTCNPLLHSIKMKTLNMFGY